MFARYDVLARNPSVLEDMNSVRRNLARVNPRGYSRPTRVRVGAETITADVLPLYLVSEVVRGKLGEQRGKRTVDAELHLEGVASMEAVRIVLSYAGGSSRAQSWAASLDEQPDLAAYVWEIARVYKIKMLEKLVRDAAFDERTHSLRRETAPRLLAGSRKMLPRYADVVLRYMCYNLDYCQRDAEFAYLTSGDVSAIISSQHLRATQAQRFNAIAKWQQNKPKHCTENRDYGFFMLVSKLLFPLITGTDVIEYRTDVREYQDWANDIFLTTGRVPPVGPCECLRVGDRAVINVFDIKQMMQVAASRATEKKAFQEYSLCFIGQFKAFDYFFQLELPWYDKWDVKTAPCVGGYLRFLHGSDMAGMQWRREVVGLLVRFRLRVHYSTDLRKSLVCSETFEADMMNLRGGRVLHGCRDFMTKKKCKQILKTMNRDGKRPEWRASVEIVHVKELLKAYAH